MKNYLRLVLFISSLCVMINTAKSQSLTWAKRMGGNGNTEGWAIAVDANGDIYTAGRFSNTADFDPGPATYNLTSQIGGQDIFICKLDGSGNFVWAKQIGGPSIDYTFSIVVDAAGNVYTTGLFGGTVDFDPGAGIYNLTAASSDIFICKLDPSGNFIWAKQMVGTEVSNGFSLAVDASGKIYMTGYFKGTVDFDPGPGNYSLTSAGVQDIYISKLDSSGNFIWTRQMGGAALDEGLSVVLDGHGNLYAAGIFSATADFDPALTTYNLTSAGGTDVFIIKLDTSGNFIWAKQVGGVSIYGDVCRAIATDANRNVYITGSFDGLADFDPGPGTYNLTSTDNSNTFVSKLDASGNFIWTKQLGGYGGTAITLDAGNNVYATGAFPGTADFDPGPGVYNLSSFGSADIFLSKLNSKGNFIWAKQMGGSTEAVGRCLALDVNGNICVSGAFSGTADFDPGPGTFNLTSSGSDDAFVIKLGSVITGISTINNSLHVTNIFPNPFSNSTTISLSLSRPAKVTAKVFDVKGRLVSILTDDTFQKGDNKIVWRAEGLSAGVYFLRMQTPEMVLTRKLVMIK